MNRCQICGGPLEWCKCPTPMSALLGPATERATNVQESTQVVATAAAVGDYDAPMFGPDRLVRHKKFNEANKFVRTWRHTDHGRTRLVVEVEDATGEKLQWWADDCEPYVAPASQVADETKPLRCSKCLNYLQWCTCVTTRSGDVECALGILRWTYGPNLHNPSTATMIVAAQRIADAFLRCERRVVGNHPDDRL